MKKIKQEGKGYVRTVAYGAVMVGMFIFFLWELQMQNQPAKKKYPTLTTLETYRRQLSEHRWIIPFNENSYAALFEQQKQEHFLWMTAFRGGIAYVNEFHQSQTTALAEYRRVVQEHTHNSTKAIYEKLIETGDVEFDAFRKSVVNFDFTYMFSDSITVWRAGNEAEKQIRENLEKGGIYKTFYDHWTSKELG